jgi:hypothetical protein
MLKRKVFPSHFKLSQSFLVHDNGGKPFKVNINDKSINVYKAKYKDYIENKYYKTPILTIRNYLGIFIGTHKYNKYKGNTILIHINNNKYIYIGENINKFETLEPITHYVSEIGGSDIPYAYANTKNYTYLMLPYQINKKDKYFFIEKKYLIDKRPYNDFYNVFIDSSKKNKYIINKKVKRLINRLTYH